MKRARCQQGTGNQPTFDAPCCLSLMRFESLPFSFNKILFTLI